MTFDGLVAGRANQMARTAALHVAGAPGAMYNPLFIYGGVGLGKTHLIHAVGNALLTDRPDARILYLHAEQFITDVVRNYQRKTFDELKAKYHSLDLLLIDDVQFFAGKERTQEEFFNTFEALLAKRAHIIMTSDTYPKGLVDIDERLTSRFDAGLTVAIEPPELEMRVAILMRKAEQEASPMPEDVAFFVAKNVRANVRELEGALRKIFAFSRFSHKEINIGLAREALRDLLQLRNRSISVESVQKTVADFYKIKVADMYSKKLGAHVTRPRQIAMYLTKELTQRSLPEIGELFGGRNHTTVLHAVRKISGERQINTELNQQLHILAQVLSRDTAPAAASPHTDVPEVVSPDPRDGIVATLRHSGLTVERIDNIRFALTSSISGLRAFEPIPTLVTRGAATEHDVEALVAGAGPTARPTGDRAGLLLYHESADALARLRIAQARFRDRFIVIPIPVSAIEQGGREGAVEAVLREYSTRYLMGADLFDDRNAISDTLSFFGRADVLDRAKRDLLGQQSIGLFGLRKAGKTSLLLQLGALLRGHPVVHVDLQLFTGRSRYGVHLFNAILAKLASYLDHRATDPQPLDVGQPTSEVSVAFSRKYRDLVAQLTQLGLKTPIVCMLDEMERIVPNEASTAEQIEEFNTVFGVLRALSQETRTFSMVVVDVFPDCNRINNWHQPGSRSNPVFSYFKEVFLPPFRMEETETMLADIGRLMGRSFDGQTISTIQEASGGHPFLSRQLASMLCTRITVDQAGNGSIRYIDADPILQSPFSASALLNNYFRQNVWSDIGKRVSGAALSLLTSLAARGKVGSAASDKILRTELDGGVSVEGLIDALLWLESAGLLERESVLSERRWRIRVGLLSRWLTLQRQPGELPS